MDVAERRSNSLFFYWVFLTLWAKDIQLPGRGLMPSLRFCRRDSKRHWEGGGHVQSRTVRLCLTVATKSLAFSSYDNNITFVSLLWVCVLGISFLPVFYLSNIFFVLRKISNDRKGDLNDMVTREITETKWKEKSWWVEYGRCCIMPGDDWHLRDFDTIFNNGDCYICALF